MAKKQKKGFVVVSAFIKRDGQYLLVFDPKFAFWRVPGGRVTFGEKVEDALKREMKEELDVEVKVVRFLGFGQDIVTLVQKKIEVSRILLYFECEIKKGKIRPLALSEISEMKRLSLEKIKEHKNLEPGMKDFFRRFKF